MRWGWFIVALCAQAAPSFHIGFAEDAPEACPSCPLAVLNRWEEASSGLMGVGPLENRRLFYLHQATHSAHEIAILNEFRGPVSAADLGKRYDWSMKQTGGQIELIGKPVDEVEKLFYKQLTVLIDPQTHLPKTLRFAGIEHLVRNEALAVVMSPRLEPPSTFPPTQSARPLQVASRDEETSAQNPLVRVVEHIALMPAPLPELPADLKRSLSLWETSARQVQSLHANVKRFTYESQNHVEQRAEGSLSYVNTPAVACTLKPAEIPPQELSRRTTDDGTAYVLLPSPAEYWQFVPTEIRFSHDPNRPALVLHRTVENANRVRIVSHEEPQTATADREQIIPPWDLLFHVKAESLAERFHIRLAQNNQTTTWEFVPRRGSDFGRFREMRVLLDNTSCLPQSVQFLNPRGDIETVYTLQYTQVQRQESPAEAPRLLPVKSEFPQ